MKTKRSQSSFEKRLDVLIYAAHTQAEFTVRDISEAVLDCHLMTVRECLKDLVDLGYLVKTTIYTFKATDMAKELFGVKA